MAKSVDDIIADQIEAAKRAGKEYQGRPSDEPAKPAPQAPASEESDEG